MKLRIYGVVAGATLLLTLGPVTAHADTAPGVGMSLSATSVSLPSGESTTVTLRAWTTSPGVVVAKTNTKGSFVTTVAPATIDLSGGINTPTFATVTVNVPTGTPDGTYVTTVGVQVQVVASSGGITLSPGVAMTLRVTVAPVVLGQTVTAGAIGPVEATANWGSEDALYVVRNTGNMAETVNLSSNDSPLLVSFMGNGSLIRAGMNRSLRVTVTAPWGTPLGVYPIVITSTVSAFGNSTSQVLPPVMIVVVA